MSDLQKYDPQDDDQVPNAAEAWKLIDALLDETITDQGRSRLEELATGDPAIARIYVRVMHLWSELPLHLGLKQAIPPAWQTEASSELLSETMVMEALKLEPPGADDSETDIFQPAPYSPPRPPTVWQKVYAFRKWLGIAAIFLLCAGVTCFVWPAPPPAVVTATAGVLLDGSTPLAPGSKLAAGQLTDIEQGAIEMRLRDGAAVTIEAPARFRLGPRNSITLISGMLAAKVPHNAIGFSVSAPGLQVVDLGTSFGVRTIDDGQGSETAVFEGHVTAAGTDSQGQGTGNPVSMTANSAMAHTIGSEPLPRGAAYVPDRYPRDISNIRMPLKLYDTGSELDSDGRDAHWQVTRVALQPDWTLQQAEIFHPSSALFNWPGATSICPHGVASPPPAGEYVFRTTVDMAGFDPKFARVVANVFATEAVVDVRINGSPAMGASLLDASVGGKPRPQALQLPNQFWNSGLNTVDFMVNYLPEDMPEYTFAGLCVDWDASAPLIVKR